MKKRNVPFNLNKKNMNFIDDEWIHKIKRGCMLHNFACMAYFSATCRIPNLTSKSGVSWKK